MGARWTWGGPFWKWQSSEWVVSGWDSEGPHWSWEEEQGKGELGKEAEALNAKVKAILRV